MSTIPLGPLDLLVIQPTPFCNIDCSYCYLPQRQSTRRISSATLEKIFERLFASGLVKDTFTVVWHAGEPLVLPVEFYEEASRIIDRLTPPGVVVQQSFQSNGMLIDDAWCDFLLRRKLSIGVSIDGPAELHDAYRKTRAGKGTHAAALKGMKLLTQRGMPFHVISVLTHRSLDYADELYSFYVEHGVREVGFNIEEIEGPNRATSLSADGAVPRYRAFISRFYDLVQQGGHALSVREFDNTASSILHGGTIEPMTTQETRPFSIINVDTEGNFCTFSPELLGLSGEPYGEFALGNVHQMPFEAAVTGEKFQRVYADISAGVHACQATCPYYNFCGGGAPSNKYYENGSFNSTETLFCRLTRKTMLELLLEKLQNSVTTAPAT